MSVADPPESLVVRAALVLEAALAWIALAWIVLTGIETPLHVSITSTWNGIRATGPLLAFNFGVFAVLANCGDRYRVYREFRDEIVSPICANLTVRGAACAAIASGIGEELFFRGALLPQLVEWCGRGGGILLSAFLFSYAHFIGSAAKYKALVLYYTLFGLYFAMVLESFADLFPCVVAHSLYNFVAMLYIRAYVAPRRVGYLKS